MIQIDVSGNRVAATVAGQFTLADYREFEKAVDYVVRFQGRVDGLLDLTDMLGYSLDVAWEELKFSRAHARDFGRIAVVTRDEWVAWSTWINRAFMEADIRLFDDAAFAEAWLSEPETAAG